MPPTSASTDGNQGLNPSTLRDFIGPWPFSTLLLGGAGLFALILLVICLGIKLTGGTVGLWGVWLIAMGALGFGALVGFIYGSFGAEESSRFGSIFTMFTGLLGGLTLVDLSKPDSGINRALLALATVCGLGEAGGGLIFFVIAGFFSIGFMLLYVQKTLLLNLPIARTMVSIADLQKSRDTLHSENPLPRPDPDIGGVKPTDTDSRTKKAARLIAQRPGAGIKGSPAKLMEDAQAFSALKRPDLAERTLRTALGKRPDDWRIKYALARVLLLEDQGKQRAACDLLRDVIQNPEAPLAAWMLFGYAALWDDEKLVEAAQASKKYLELYPHSPGASLNLACAYAQLAGKAPAAEQASYRAKALTVLRELFSKHSSYRQRVRQLLDEDFSALKHDPELLKLLNSPCPDLSFSRPVSSSAHEVAITQPKASAPPSAPEKIMTSPATTPVPTQTTAAAPAPSPSYTLALDQIQGNILGGFNKDYQSFLFLEFTDANMARQWIGAITPEVATAEELVLFDGLFKKVNRRRGGELGIVKSTWMNIAFSHSGLEKLGLPKADLDKFPEGFRAGMAARADLLGDTGPHAPSSWIKPLGQRRVHALMIVASDNQEDLGENVLRYIHNMGVNGGVQLVYLQQGAVREDEPGHEHFGFRDGVSQPGVRHFDPHVLGVVAPAEPIQGDPGQDRLHAGEFVLGYPTQIPSAKKCPNGTVSPNPDPGPDSLNPDGKTEKAPSWARNGSYLVFRRLAQDVGKFREQLADLAKDNSLSVEVMGAKLVGRYASGAPLELTKDEEALMTGVNLPQGFKPLKNFDPAAGDPSQAVADALGVPPDATTNEGNLAEDDRLNNHFEYGDDPGKIVPRAAHIRKAYPRDEKRPQGDENDSQTHRILRRGLPFGTSFRPGLGAVGHAGKPGVEEPGDRGLLFLCYQSSIERQFEFIQKNWVHNPDFPCPNDGEDPIIAQTSQGGFRFLPQDGDGGQKAHLTIMHFVTMTGGEYFFQPSIEALEKIIGTPAAKPFHLDGVKDEGDLDQGTDPCTGASQEDDGGDPCGDSKS